MFSGILFMAGELFVIGIVSGMTVLGYKVIEQSKKIEKLEEQIEGSSEEKE